MRLVKSAFLYGRGTLQFVCLVSLALLMGNSWAQTSDDAASDSCMEVSLTGTLGGPAFYKDLAGSGTLVKVGSVENNCGDVHLQFDIGRATGMRLSQLDVAANQIDAVFITHLHSDHTVGLVDFVQTRWHFFGQTLDLVCSADIEVFGDHARQMSCANFAESITAAAENAGEIAQRSSESTRREPAGPQSMINHMPVELSLIHI